MQLHTSLRAAVVLATLGRAADVPYTQILTVYEDAEPHVDANEDAELDVDANVAADTHSETDIKDKSPERVPIGTWVSIPAEPNSTFHYIHWIPGSPPEDLEDWQAPDYLVEDTDSIMVYVKPTDSVITSRMTHFRPPKNPGQSDLVATMKDNDGNNFQISAKFANMGLTRDRQRMLFEAEEPPHAFRYKKYLWGPKIEVKDATSGLQVSFSGDYPGDRKLMSRLFWWHLEGDQTRVLVDLRKLAVAPKVQVNVSYAQRAQKLSKGLARKLFAKRGSATLAYYKSGKIHRLYSPLLLKNATVDGEKSPVVMAVKPTEDGLESQSAVVLKVGSNGRPEMTEIVFEGENNYTTVTAAEPEEEE